MIFFVPCEIFLFGRRQESNAGKLRRFVEMDELNGNEVMSLTK